MRKISRHSLSYNLNQRKYNLKFFIYVFILFDILLAVYVPFFILWIIIGWEVSVFLGILIGLKGQGRYRELVYELIAIRRDPKYNDKESLRGHKLARHIDNAIIEYDIWFDNYGDLHKFKENNSKKIIKNKKKKRGRRLLIWDDVVEKQAGYALVGILGILGLGFAYLMALVEWHWIIIFVLAGIWEILDGFLFFYIHYVFNLPAPETSA